MAKDKEKAQTRAEGKSTSKAQQAPRKERKGQTEDRNGQRQAQVSLQILREKKPNAQYEIGIANASRYPAVKKENIVPIVLTPSFRWRPQAPAERASHDYSPPLGLPY